MKNDVTTHIVATANPVHGKTSADKSLNNSSTIPAKAEVTFEASCAGPRPCSPELALKAIEEMLTPKKYARYAQKQSAGQNKDNDPVYSTWAYLRAQVKRTASPYLMDDHHLVQASAIPCRLVDVIHVPPDRKYKDYIYGRCMYRSTWKKKEYLRSKDKAEKRYDVSRHIWLHKSKHKKWWYTIHYYIWERTFTSEKGHDQG